ncbi:MAG: thymidylate [Desulfobulbaceae bacterium]|nr:MAG: thymidylate [Desulfobulbaceae bacterium]
MKNAKKGLLIVFEGIDGTGKSTQLSLLAATLRQHGIEVIETREPTMGQFGRQIRALYTNRNGVSPEQELELFLADRREHVQNLLIPALEEGKVVLCDRYFLSTAAYQGCLGDAGRASTSPGSSDTQPSLACGFTPSEIIGKNSFAPNPDLALLFCLSPQAGIQRITTGRGDILNDFEHEAVLERVAAIFDSLQLPYIHRVDASGSIESVSQSVMRAVRPLLFPLDQNGEVS